MSLGPFRLASWFSTGSPQLYTPFAVGQAGSAATGPMTPAPLDMTLAQIAGYRWGRKTLTLDIAITWGWTATITDPSDPSNPFTYASSGALVGSVVLPYGTIGYTPISPDVSTRRRTTGLPFFGTQKAALTGIDQTPTAAERLTWGVYGEGPGRSSTGIATDLGPLSALYAGGSVTGSDTSSRYELTYGEGVWSQTLTITDPSGPPIDPVFTTGFYNPASFVFEFMGFTPSPSLGNRTEQPGLFFDGSKYWPTAQVNIVPILQLLDSDGDQASGIVADPGFSLTSYIGGLGNVGSPSGGSSTSAFLDGREIPLTPCITSGSPLPSPENLGVNGTINLNTSDT